MTDLISRQDAIALLERMFCYGRDDWDAGADAAIGRAIEALTNMPSAESELQAEIADLQRQLEWWDLYEWNDDDIRF